MPSASATYSTCCQQGAVQLPSDHMENTLTPPFLQRLFTSSKKFRTNIRSYNNAVSFTSTAAKQDMTVAREGGAWSYRIRGSLTHLIGSLLPVPNGAKKFAQMFIFGDQAQDKIALRTPANSPMASSILQQLLNFMYAHNSHAKTYKAVEDILAKGPTRTIKIKSLPIAGRDKNQYNFPTCSQVAAIIEGDDKIGSKDRNVIVQLQSGQLRRISKLNTNYFSLRYPLFYIYGLHGWDEHYCHFTLCRMFQ
ncbi:hypothetical protein DFH28DRAFT_918387 [Melampsora americana]|nr:hypothetical protein DFH28DRAFT_918387 [Melampsora americana]